MKKMTPQQKKRTGKFMSLVLRHSPEKIAINLDGAGWARVDKLLSGLAKHGHKLSFEQLEDIVESNDKQRYSFNDDKTQIRANQGHSIKLDLQLEAKQPPEVLYHGTASRFMQSINEQGLQKRNRHHVHLSQDKETATNVGRRHGKPVILSIASGAMHRAGYEFFCSENQVWLTDHVPTKYIN